MITKDMVRKAFADKKARIIDSPYEDGVVCWIGDELTTVDLLYFGGKDAEKSTAEEYVKNVPMDDIVDDVFNVLEGFRMDGDEIVADEYSMYEHILKAEGTPVTKQTLAA